MSFATQALASSWTATIIRCGRGARRAEAIEEEVASLKLAAMSIKIDTLTAEQKKYLTSWETGT